MVRTDRPKSACDISKVSDRHFTWKVKLLVEADDEWISSIVDDIYYFLRYDGNKKQQLTAKQVTTPVVGSNEIMKKNLYAIIQHGTRQKKQEATTTKH